VAAGWKDSDGCSYYSVAPETVHMLLPALPHAESQVSVTQRNLQLSGPNLPSRTLGMALISPSGGLCIRQQTQQVGFAAALLGLNRQ
jgi:hypothetical protein